MDAAPLLYYQSRNWAARLRRQEDFYQESALLWLEADTIIRRESKGRKSLDDFCRLFYGAPSTGPKVVPYDFDDVVKALTAGNVITLAGNLYIRDQMPLVPMNTMVRDIQEIGTIPLRPGLNVYIRDTRYVLESFTTVLFWLVPIFYSFSIIPKQYADIYRFNPVAALVLAMRNILMEGIAPPMSLIVNLTVAAAFAIGLGIIIFNRLKPRFYEHI